jgi:anaerobic selenocysteine-containing dehydrogenase
MHNIDTLMTGENRCTLWIHSADAAAYELDDGDEVLLENTLHSESVPIRITDDIRQGVVSLPHGYGHKRSAQWQRVAGRHAGVSFNDWTSDDTVESVVAQSILNGVGVSIKKIGKNSGDKNSGDSLLISDKPAARRN